MRITNKIMQNNSLNNINYNKIIQDKLNTQMSTQKKINRPSDDPVVAIRALRLRSNVTEISQYYTKNIPDAESWLSVTEGALKNVTEVITDMISQYTKGSNADLTTEDRKIILESLKALQDEVYATGDADYAGRYVFTGHRTDTSLMYASPTEESIQITEQLTKDSISSLTHINMRKEVADGSGGTKDADLTEINAGNYEDMDFVEQDISAEEIYRIRLAYDGLDADKIPTLTWTDADGSQKPFTDASSTPVVTKMIHSYENPYAQIEDDSIIFVPETGEILLGKNMRDQMLTKTDSPTTSNINEGEIRISYEKKEWEKGDLRPEHYFACTKAPGTADAIEYNQEYLDFTSSRQVIEYDIGFNQKIQVNSTADECFKHDVGRDVDDMVKALEDMDVMEKVIADLTDLKKANIGTDKEDVIDTRIEAANKAYSLMKNKIQKMFEGGITAMQGHLDSVNLAVTNNGTRSKKLELVETRMMSQKTTFETLQSENEDVDITEVAIQLTSAEMTYEAALMATGKVMQTTLLDFI